MKYSAGCRARVDSSGNRQFTLAIVGIFGHRSSDRSELRVLEMMVIHDTATAVVERVSSKNWIFAQLMPPHVGQAPECI